MSAIVARMEKAVGWSEGNGIKISDVTIIHFQVQNLHHLYDFI